MFKNKKEQPAPHHLQKQYDISTGCTVIFDIKIK